MSRPIRTVVYGILLLLALVWLAARAAPPPDESDEGERDVTTEKMEEVLAALRSETANGGRLVIVLGDSSLRWHPPLGPDETLTAMLEREGEQAGVTIKVVAYDGFDAVAYYLLVDEIAALRPVAVVLTTNLQSFTDSWFSHVRMKHPQLAAFIRPTRVPEAITLPLEVAGITDASLVLMPALRSIGASDVPEKVDGYRTRVRSRLDAILARGATTAMAGPQAAYAAAPPLLPPPAGARLPARRPKAGLGAPPRGRGRAASKPAYRFMDLYPDRLQPEQSTVRVLRATVRDLVARDVPTIVMLAPMHLQAARVTGAYTGRNLPQAIRVIDEMTIANGGAFLDLAEILPLESFFIDRYTHLTAQGNRLVADRLLEELRRGLAPGTRPTT